MKFVSRSELAGSDGAELGRSQGVRLLWAAFPSARSEHAIAAQAAIYLGVTEKTVRNWLRGTHQMKLGDAARLGALVGFEAFLGALYGKE